MPKCTTNITMPLDGEAVTVTLAVDFEVAPPDPDVGIMGCGVEGLVAKVIDADVEGVTPAELQRLQADLDANLGKHYSAIEEGCLESLDDFDDDREAIAEGDYRYYRSPGVRDA